MKPEFRPLARFHIIFRMESKLYKGGCHEKRKGIFGGDNEMYIALQQGVADGAELPIDYFYDYSIYEVAKYLNMTFHTFGTQFLGINYNLWKSLSPQHQKAIQEAADEAGIYNNNLASNLQKEYLKKLVESGMERVDTNVEEIKKALDEKIPEIAANWAGTETLYRRIQEIK